MSKDKKRKTLCKWKKDRIDKELDALKEIVRAPKFVCKNCGRAADDKGWLCKPSRIGDAG